MKMEAPKTRDWRLKTEDWRLKFQGESEGEGGIVKGRDFDW